MSGRWHDLRGRCECPRAGVVSIHVSGCLWRKACFQRDHNQQLGDPVFDHTVIRFFNKNLERHICGRLQKIRVKLWEYLRRKVLKVSRRERFDMSALLLKYEQEESIG